MPKTPHHILIACMLSSIPWLACTQVNTLRTSVFFAKNKFVLEPDEKKVIDKILDTLQLSEIKKINLTGNADNSADSIYNIKLSEQRIAEVKSYLISKGLMTENIESTAFGEDKPIADNNKEEGQQKNRRVDIVFYLKPKPAPQETKVEKVSSKKTAEADSCSGDTIIILPQGTQLIFNRCEYKELKDCLEFIETNNSDAIISSGLSLMDTLGFPLASCGMLRIGLKPGCSDKDCFETPVKVLIPVPKEKECDFCGRNARVWSVAPNGGWEQGKGNENEIKIINVRGEKFYQMQVYCPNMWKNCDCKLPTGPRVKIKAPSGYKILELKVVSDCPTTVIELQTRMRKNVAKGRIPCLIGEKYIVAILEDPSGRAFVLPKKPLDELKKKTFLSLCKKIKGEYIGLRLGFIPIPKRNMYRKYLLIE
ncbi:MAG: OmpA family protein [Flavobacteriales bacterium]|jgi:hypothetical protein